MGKKSKLASNDTDSENLYSFGFSAVDTEKASDRNQDSYYHTSIGQSNLNKIFKEDAKGKIRINFNKQKSKFQGGENPSLVPDETKPQTSVSIGKDYVGFQIKKKFSRGGGVAIKGTKFTGVK
jgi:hypothetical protein